MRRLDVLLRGAIAIAALSAGCVTEHVLFSTDPDKDGGDLLSHHPDGAPDADPAPDGADLDAGPDAAPVDDADEVITPDAALDADVVEIPDGDVADGDVADGDVEVVPIVHEPTTISGGLEHTCAVTPSGGVQCWGLNVHYGYLGTGETFESSPVPVDVVGLAGEVVEVAAGNYHTCARLADGSIQCWGDNSGGTLGIGTVEVRESPLPVSVADLGSPAVDLDSGASHSCVALENEEVWCWGADLFGEVGVDPATLPDGQIAAGPVLVEGLAGPVVSLSLGQNHSCALLESGQVQCWGWNERGQLGVDPRLTSWSPTPLLVPGLVEPVVVVTSGGEFNCALTAAGVALCWGSNEVGQLGNGDIARMEDPPILEPNEVLGLGPGVLAIRAGFEFTCALAADRHVRCWGNNFTGQLGDGTGNAWAPPSPVPVEVVGLEDVQAIGTGIWVGCAQTPDALWCWGRNAWGQLGCGESDLYDVRNAPVQVVDFGL